MSSSSHTPPLIPGDLNTRTINVESKAKIAEMVATWSGWKNSVRLATTANLASLSGLLVIDGVTVSAGDLVLVKNQTTTVSMNGIYVARAENWVRSNYMPTGSTVVGLATYVYAGDTNAGEVYRSTATTGVIGTNDPVFSSVVNTDSVVVTKVTVTQTTSITTAVTINAAAGKITTVSLTTDGNVSESAFTVNNTSVLATSVIVTGIQYNGTGIPVIAIPAVSAGSFTVEVSNASTTGTALNAPVTIHFMVL